MEAVIDLAWAWASASEGAADAGRAAEIAAEAIPNEEASATTANTLLRDDLRGAGEALVADVEYSSA